MGYIHDLLHFDCGYTDDEIDEIVESSHGIFNCTDSEIMETAGIKSNQNIKDYG